MHAHPFEKLVSTVKEQWSRLPYEKTQADDEEAPRQVSWLFAAAGAAAAGRWRRAARCPAEAACDSAAADLAVCTAMYLNACSLFLLSAGAGPAVLPGLGGAEAGPGRP